MSLTRRAALGAIGAAAVGAAARCTDDQDAEPEAISLVDVDGEFAAYPQVRFPNPLEVRQAATRQIIEGEGARLDDGSPVMLSYLAVDAVTGETIDTNFDASPEIFLLNEENAGVLYTELLTLTEGSRMLRLELGTDERPNGAIVVYDVRHTAAWGTEVEPPDGAPEVRIDDDGAPVVVVPDTDPPTDLELIPLRRGDGAQVRPGEAVTVRYTTVSWSTGEVADTLWGEGLLPTTIPFTGLIPAWQNGLVDEQVGSRVMLITPPEQAFGTDNLVFVIDVLAVAPSPEGESEGSES